MKPKPGPSQEQSKLTVGKSYKEAGGGHIGPVIGMFDFQCSALPPLPPKQEDEDSKSNTLPSDSQVKTNGTTISNHPDCTNKFNLDEENCR